MIENNGFYDFNAKVCALAECHLTLAKRPIDRGQPNQHTDFVRFSWRGVQLSANSERHIKAGLRPEFRALAFDALPDWIPRVGSLGRPENFIVSLITDVGLFRLVRSRHELGLPQRRNRIQTVPGLLCTVSLSISCRGWIAQDLSDFLASQQKLMD